MSEVMPYRFPGTGHNIRVIEIDGEPWFIAGDVALALGYRDAYNATRWLLDAERGTHLVSTPGHQQEVTIISEAGLYRMVMRSNKEQAVQFQLWIAHEVLPAIRKTGHYAVAPMTPAEILLAQAQQLVDQERRITHISSQLTELGARVDGIEQRSGWYTALGFARMHNLPTDHASLNRLGRDAARITRRAGIEPAKVTNEAFGEVGSYPESCLREAAETCGLVAR